MSAKRKVVENDSELTLSECEIVLRALGSYQIQLFDKMSSQSTKEARDSILGESNLVSSAIKKVHHLMEKNSSAQVKLSENISYDS
jgi:hypothetical protein